MSKPTWSEFLFHYDCEWDTGEFLGWDEVRICMEQLGMIEPEPESEQQQPIVIDEADILVSPEVAAELKRLSDLEEKSRHASLEVS